MFITSSLPESRVKEYFCKFVYIFKLHYMMLLWYLKKRELLGLYTVRSSCRPKILQSNLFRIKSRILSGYKLDITKQKKMHVES